MEITKSIKHEGIFLSQEAHTFISEAVMDAIDKRRATRLSIYIDRGESVDNITVKINAQERHS